MARRSKRVAAASTKPLLPKDTGRTTAPPMDGGLTTASPSESPATVTPLNGSPMNELTTARPAPPPIKPGFVTFLDLAGEIRNQIYSELLLDPDPQLFQKAQRRQKLRVDGRPTSTNFMRTCHQVYREAISILYPSTISETLELDFQSQGMVYFLGRAYDPSKIGPSNFSVITRAKRLRLDIEIEDLSADEVCDVQDEMFIFTSLLGRGHQLQGLSVSIEIGDDRSDVHDYDMEQAIWEMMVTGRQPASRQVSRMQEFKDVKPGDLSRGHLAAFLTDPLRMIRGVRKGRKAETVSLFFSGRTGRPWRDLQGQVYDVVCGNTPVVDLTTFTKYFDALRQAQKLIYVIGDRSATKTGDHYAKLFEYLGEARIRGDMEKFLEGHRLLLSLIDSSVKDRAGAGGPPKKAEVAEQDCLELGKFRNELEEALPNADLDVSSRGYNIADAALHEWQTVRRKEETKARKKRKADRAAADQRWEDAKKARLAEINPAAAEASGESV